MKKQNLLLSKNLDKITFIVSFFIVLTIISSSLFSVTICNKSEINISDFKVKKKEIKVSNFQESVGIPASMIQDLYTIEHDVGVFKIYKPWDGDAGENMKVIVEVENYGNNIEENIPVNVIILKEENEEYNETEYIDVLNPGEIVNVAMPSWTPDEWQDSEFENSWQNYLIKACTLLEDDDPENNCLEKQINLYYPWLHDIELTSIDSPNEDGPGKTYPVQASIKNVGQYADCCISIDIKIGEFEVLETLSTEDTWNTVPPAGWHDEHKDFNPGYGWNKSFTKNSGGSSPEAYLSYYNALAEYVMYSYAIDTSAYAGLKLEFLSYINHYSGQGLYALEAGFSYDAEEWYAAWHEEPSGSGKYKVTAPIESGASEMYIGFWVKGDPYYFNYWYIDNVKLVATGLVEEYSDSACQGPEIEPGKEVTLEFNDWTPEFLQYEKTAEIDYTVQAYLNMDGDGNPGNDILQVDFTLEYWHNVWIGQVTSPATNNFKGYILWDNGLPDGRNYLPSSMYLGYSNIIIDDFENEAVWCVEGARFRFVWDSGYQPGNMGTVRVYFFEETGNCEPSEDEYYILEVTSFYEYATGDYYFDRPEIICELEFDEVELPPGKWWVGFQPDGIIEDIAFLLTSESKGCGVMADLPFWGYPRWTSSMSIWGEEYDLSWELYAIWPSLPVWIQPGIKDINVIVVNYGTFPELDLTCYAEIYEYITHPKIGTLVYEDNITNIDIEEPLGGTEDLEFEDYNFSIEGKYRLYLNMPDEDDDYPGNNKKTLRIDVDNTPPCSNHSLEPQNPDGNNDWYVNDVKVILTASDPLSNSVSSGVDEIRYTINGGVEQVLPGWEGGSFLITEDGKDIMVEYWSVDRAGNVETKKSFTINLDKTKPDIDLEWKVYTELGSRNVKFICNAIDETSGIDKIEMYINDRLYETKTESPYEFVIEWSGDVKISIFKFIAFDIAGNSNFDLINGSDIKSVSRSQSVYRFPINILFMRLFERFQYIFPILKYLF